MKNTKVEPRSIRTRRLLMDGFIKLTYKKDFKDIIYLSIRAPLIAKEWDQ
jgi:hypothetical protein